MTEENKKDNINEAGDRTAEKLRRAGKRILRMLSEQAQMRSRQMQKSRPKPR